MAGNKVPSQPPASVGPLIRLHFYFNNLRKYSRASKIALIVKLLEAVGEELPGAEIILDAVLERYIKVYLLAAHQTISKRDSLAPLDQLLELFDANLKVERV